VGSITPPIALSPRKKLSVRKVYDKGVPKKGKLMLKRNERMQNIPASAGHSNPSRNSINI
jgi:hypothetical protein